MSEVLLFRQVSSLFVAVQVFCQCDRMSCVKITDFGLSQTLVNDSHAIAPTAEGTRSVPTSHIEITFSAGHCVSTLSGSGLQL